jgi:hypothetical protein
MTAFLVCLAVTGWRPGAAFPTGHDLMAATGATFMTVLLAVDGLDKRLRREPHPDGDHRPFAETARHGMLGPWRLRVRDR